MSKNLLNFAFPALELSQKHEILVSQGGVDALFRWDEKLLYY